jgi:IS30 family transposase
MQNERKNPDYPRQFGQRVGLVRQYFPKKTDFSKVTLSETMIAVDRLNHRPRKCLDFKIPF